MTALKRAMYRGSLGTIDIGLAVRVDSFSFLLVVSLLTGLASLAANASMPGAARATYDADLAIQETLNALAARSGRMLPRFRVRPSDAERFHSSFKKGPGRRDFSNKMVYAPNRGTALYCGANHNSPHRLNDVWEFHLPGNTWHLISPPASDAYQLKNLLHRKKRAAKAMRQGIDVEANRRFVEEEYSDRVRAWYECCTVEDGYLQAKGNGGPIRPYHTWDGVTYDQRTGRLYWAVLDLNHESMARRWAKITGRDPEKAAKALQPASTMYIFDPSKGRWRRQMGEPPFPRMHGMGGTLVYLPDRDVTLWYVAATNRTPNDFAMWSYDSGSNHWRRLLGDKEVRHLVHTAKVAPGSELQAAYSARHGKLVAVQKKDTFIFDVESNRWSRAAGTPGFGHDAHGVFAYDSNADVFLLVSRDDFRSNGPWRVHAYDLKTNTWETVKVGGEGVPDDTSRKSWLKYKFAGYYDPEQNVLVLYEGRTASTWIYRHAGRRRDHPEQLGAKRSR